MEVLVAGCKKPLVSIIITTFNRRDFIIEAVESALDQTYSNIEIIIVDDGSTDATDELINKTYKNELRVSYYYKENGKRASAFNLGFEMSKGQFIAILDSDNRYKPERIEAGVTALMENPEFDISYGDIITINEAGKEIHRKNMRRYSGNISEQLVYDNCVSINTALIPRRCFEDLGLMDVSYKRSDDYELWLRFSTQYKFLYISQYLAEYRVMENQLSSNTLGRLDVNLRLIEDFRLKHGDRVGDDRFRQAFCRIHALKSIDYSKKRERMLAIKEFLKAFKNKPLERVTLKSLVFLLGFKK
ncbi:glycosyltransferase [Marinobacter sp. BW6]|uniref:glycosyltransferase n=1 Tax=Marinobacter sp. BW6 TaxID=2592624 RepID=UPI0011DE6ABF|nr:glycosyltransferase [Marinobacter sp. BW6]TYC62714.1 glycosyltransferase [Marinobacter sp. BW6]